MRNIFLIALRLSCVVLTACTQDRSPTVPSLTSPSNARLSAAASTFGTSGVQSVATGGAHTCILNSLGQAFCVGRNDRGQLGTGNTLDSPELVPVQGGLRFISITAGQAFSCGLREVGDTYCWGANEHGQLGAGDFIDSPVPRNALGALNHFKAIAAAGWHACGVDVLNYMYCWGANNYGQLGNGSGKDSPLETPVAGQFTYVSVAVGYRHTCGITTNNQTACWGDNRAGEVGIGSISPSVVVGPALVHGGDAFTQVAAGNSFTCGTTAASLAFCWGKNLSGELGTGSTTGRSLPAPVAGGQQFTQLSLGTGHGCGVTVVATAYCWGDNIAGDLGNNSTTRSTIPVRVQGLQSLTSIATGQSHACASDASGQSSCWGLNASGQLGDGTRANRKTPVPLLVPATSVVVAPPSFVLTVGTARPLTATIYDALGNVLTGRPIVWTSSNVGVAAVGLSGLVSGLVPGAATIMAASGSARGTASVSVTPVPVSRVVVSPASLTIVTGATATLSATTYDEQGNLLTGRVVTWASSNSAVASVTPGGGSAIIAAAGSGSAVVRATSEGVTGSATVTVPPPPPPSQNPPTRTGCTMTDAVPDGYVVTILDYSAAQCGVLPPGLANRWTATYYPLKQQGAVLYICTQLSSAPPGWSAGANSHTSNCDPYEPSATHTQKITKS